MMLIIWVTAVVAGIYLAHVDRQEAAGKPVSMPVLRVVQVAGGIAIVLILISIFIDTPGILFAMLGGQR